jgi:stringent starvation protein B
MAPPDQKIPARKPYLLRAMHQWMTDASLTPHVVVDAEQPNCELPRAYVKDGKIVLNVSYNATQRLEISNDWIVFDARFAGVIHHVRFPLQAVLGVYARETGEGMAFGAEDGGPSPDKPGAGPGDDPSRRPQLKIVK